MSGIEPAGTYRPQYRLRWRRLSRALGLFPGLKARLAAMVRRVAGGVFEPGMVTTERVIEYPFVFEHLRRTAAPVLDMGCCGSRQPIALASRGFRVVGIDFNPYPFRHPNLRALRGDVMRLPFRSASFGAVLAISVVEHIGIGHYGDPAADDGDARTVDEIRRVLRPEGQALVTVPFGRAMTDDFQRVYDRRRLERLLAPLDVVHLEHAWTDRGLWRPCSEEEAATIDWRGDRRALAMVVSRRRHGG